MDRLKFKKAIIYAAEHPDSAFAIELKKRVSNGEFNEILEKEGIGTSRFSPKEPSIFKKVGKSLIRSEIEFGQSLAGATDIFTGGRAGGGKNLEYAQSKDAEVTRQLLSVIRNKKSRGQNTARFEKLLPSFANNNPFKNHLLDRLAAQTPRQVVGQGLGVAADVIGGGTVGRTAAATVTQPTRILAGAGRGALQGAGTGAAFGGAQGLARGLQDDREGQDLLQEVATGAVVGGVAGGVLGGVTGGVSGGLRGRALRKQQLIDELQNNPELVAKFQLDDAGKVIKNKPAAELLRQGIPERQVAVIQNASDVDKNKFVEMFETAQRASRDARTIKRPSDVVGSTIVERTRHLLGQTQKAGRAVDEAAEAIAGQRVDMQAPVQGFSDDLGTMGIRMRNGQPIFDGSDIEGIKPAETLIKRVVERAGKIGDDAAEWHRLKKFIDEQVSFGKAGEGLTGQTSRVVKGFRAAIDDVLDTNFADYNTANTAYSTARNLLDDTGSVLGRSFDPASGNIKAGSVARRILGNSANRGDILDYLNSLEKFYQNTGGKGGDDIIAQTVFADILEDIFGTQATTGLQGQIGRAVEQAGGVVQDIGQGQLITGLTRAGVRTFQAIRGISPEAQIKALGNLIGAR